MSLLPSVCELKAELAAARISASRCASTRNVADVPDAIFANPRLAQMYDWLELERPDLDVYVAMAQSFKAQTVLDIGCGTGTLCLLLAAEGLEVIGVDPAEASLDVARLKPDAEQVRWFLSDAAQLPPLQVDLVFMTGNVAQVFLSDETWIESLQAIHAALKHGGRLVFETRNPAREAWLGWTRGQTETVTEVPGVGKVTSWCELLNVAGPFVSFRWTYVFASNNEIVTSDSTLRFRTQSEIEHSLVAGGFVVEEIRDAPDRLGLEFVFIATSTETPTHPLSAQHGSDRG